jgi:hypothetical protein
MFFDINFVFVIVFQLANFAENDSLAPSSSISKKNTNEKLNPNLLEKNSLVDATTAMFYHVENTKKCGNNLQIFNIDLKPFWNVKLKAQIKKAIRLANSVNLVLNKNGVNSQTQQANGKAKEEDVENYLIESNFLSSLSYFIFSQSTSESLTPFKLKNEEKSYGERDLEDNVFSKQNQNLINADPYIVGYGVILYKKENGLSKPKCLYIKKDLKNSIGNFQTNNSCTSMNVKLADEQYSKLFINEYEDEESEDPPPANHNCLNWSENLKSSYENFLDQSSFLTDNIQSINYDLFLEKLLHNKEFTHSTTSPLWCGPYYECSADQNSNDWLLLFALPIFDKDKKIKGSVVVKLKITNMDVNQCVQGDPVFSNTHKCKPNSNCVFNPSNLFKSGIF